jgi:hypothetical protein
VILTASCGGSVLRTDDRVGWLLMGSFNGDRLRECRERNRRIAEVSSKVRRTIMSQNAKRILKIA